MRLRSVCLPVATLVVLGGIVGCDMGSGGPSAPTSPAANAAPVPTQPGTPTKGEKTKKNRQAPGTNAPAGAD
jgi:hypothetical protein